MKKTIVYQYSSSYSAVKSLSRRNTKVAALAIVVKEFLAVITTSIVIANEIFVVVAVSCDLIQLVVAVAHNSRMACKLTWSN